MGPFDSDSDYFPVVSATDPLDVMFGSTEFKPLDFCKTR